MNVTGTVVDANGERLPGVSILLKGTNTGTMTDMNGKFSIQVPSSDAILRFSYLGYESRHVKVDTKKMMNIVMKEQSTALDEVVVVGYQEVRRKDLTGSVAKANINDMLKTPITRFDQALAGRIAGVQVSSGEGGPGASFNIVVRGNNSLTQSNSPLFVIDGFPVEDAGAASINPADIESLDVLKDASATAIYGARGANGVVIITTKKGKIGKPVITYNGSVSLERLNNKLDLMDAYEFVRLQEELYSPSEMLEKYFSEGRTLESYRNIPDQYDWQDEVFRTAISTNHYLSISGGTADTRYNSSLSYVNQNGIIINSAYTRFQGRFSLDQRINSKLKINLNANYSRGITSGSSPSAASSSASSSFMYSVWGYRPVTYDGTDLRTALWDPDVNTANDYRFNPILSVRNEYRKNTQDDLVGNAFAEYTFIKGLKLKVSGGYRLKKRLNEAFNGSKTRYGNASRSEGVNASVRNYDDHGWLNENVLSYSKYINKKHNISALAGMTFQGNYSNMFRSDVQQIAHESLGMAGMDSGLPKLIESSIGENKLMSYLARFNYAFESKYYLTASFRADGSSKFSPKNRWGYFPSASVAWNFDKENFLKGIDWLNNGKLRLSWGQTGNNRVSDYAYMGSITPSMTYEYPFGETYYPGFRLTAIENPNLKWETTDQTNLGIDLSFLGERINFTADLYHKLTRNLLLYADLPYTTGFSKAYLNIGKMANRGIELTLETVNIKNRDFTWTSNFNISFNRSEVKELSGNQETLLSTVTFDNAYKTPSYIAKVGKPLGLMYGYIYEGTYKPEDFENGVLKSDIPTNGSERNMIHPGDARYKDINGDNKVDEKDQTIIGRGEPIHVGGFTNNFTYKNFDLNIFFTWSYGNDILNANRLIFENSLTKKETNMFASYADRWTPQNPQSNIPRAGDNSPRVFSSRVIEDGSYLRLKSVALGYTLPRKIARRCSLESARIFITGENLWTWTSYTGYDPEVSVRNSALTPGFDFSAYPRAYNFSLGVNLSF
ncbi:SusC/RagA family TonB-linked outer membrane protein [Coprobacter tertius]